MTQSEIEPATFRFVAQHLNHCATAVPKVLVDYFEIKSRGRPVISVDSWLHHLPSRQEQNNLLKNFFLRMFCFMFVPSSSLSSYVNDFIN
jgi:hypothetical protein